MAISVSIVGSSGYTGGEMLRLLLGHPEFEVKQVTSRTYNGKFVSSVHPNLRKATDLRFCMIDDLEPVDVLVVALPHGKGEAALEKLGHLAKEAYVDLSQDFRISDKFVYGHAELHREELKTAKFIAGAGCNATATILALYPFYNEGLIDQNMTVAESKISSSAAGNKASTASHHPERAGCVRSFKPTGHRHVLEICEELNTKNMHFSATSIEMVRGILLTAHIFPKKKMEDKDIWKLYRKYYGEEPFIRIVKDRTGIYRYPEPKLVAGTNFCDIGFEVDSRSDRIVVMSAIDNLVKGSAGHVMQSLNVRFGFDERLGLEFTGLHPV